MRRIIVGLVAAIAVMGCNPGEPTTDAGVDAGVDAGTQPEVCVTLLPERFPVSTTLAGGCYLAQKTPVISAGVTLTMQPGVKIVFSRDVDFSISADQVLLAQGTAEHPIVFTALLPERGFWKGLGFEGTSTPSRLDWVIVEYGGNTTADRDAAGIKLSADSRGVRVGLTHTIVRHSQGWGLSASGSSVFPQFEANTFTLNTLGPAALDAPVVGVLDAASGFAGNTRDELVVYGMSLTDSATWKAIDVPYYVSKRIALSTADLTLQPGVTLHMADGSGFEVPEGSTLNAAGTALKPIVMTGVTKTRGAWKGLVFGSNDARNVLDHVTIEWAGDITSDWTGSAVKVIADSRGAQLRMANTRLTDSEGFGLYLSASAILTDFNGNVLTRNGSGPAYVGSETVHQLLPTSTYAGNDLDRVQVGANWVNDSVTWNALDVPYRLDGKLRPQKVLTIAPGTTIELTEQSSISVAGTDDVAGLHAVGTAALPITFTGVTKTAGFWDGITFDGDNNPANALDHCIVEYGGGATRLGWKGMIFSHSDSHGVTVSVTNSTVRYSATYGIWFNSGQAGSVSGNTYSNNAQGDYFREQP